MTLQTSGPISLGDINVELGRPRAAQISLTEPACRTLAGKPTGQVSIFDFYGKSVSGVEDYVMTAGYRRGSGKPAIDIGPGYLINNIGSINKTLFKGYVINSILGQSFGFGFSLVGSPDNAWSRIEVYSGATLLVARNRLDYGPPSVNGNVKYWALGEYMLTNGATYNVKIYG